MADQLTTVTGDGGATEAIPVTIFKSIQSGGGEILFDSSPSGVTPVTGSGANPILVLSPALGRQIVFFADAAVTVAVTRKHPGGSSFYPCLRSDGSAITLTVPASGGYVSVPWVETVDQATLQFAITGSANVRVAQ